MHTAYQVFLAAVVQFLKIPENSMILPEYLFYTGDQYRLVSSAPGSTWEARNTAMAILRRESKRSGKVSWQVLVDTRDPITKARKRHTIGSFRLKSAAQVAERRAFDQIQAGTFQPEPVAPPRVWTVGDVVTSWLTGKKATLSSNSLSQYDSVWRRHVEPALGDHEVTGLTRADVRVVVRAWQAQGMGAQLQNRCLLVLRCALDEAVEDGILTANPAAGIRLPSPKKRRDLPQWTPDHLRAFLTAAEEDQLGVFWWLTAVEGMRRAEALGLRWSDIQWSGDETAARATIVQTVVADAANGGRALIQHHTKTRGSQRTVSLTPTTTQALRRHRDRQAFQRQAMGELWRELGLIVTDEIGGAIRPAAVRTHRLTAMTTHDLRHFAATAMLRAGVSPAIVAAKVGHADIGLTVGTYGHLIPDDQASANAALESFLATPTMTGTADG
jgi:integrase